MRNSTSEIDCVHWLESDSLVGDPAMGLALLFLVAEADSLVFGLGYRDRVDASCDDRA